MKKSWVVFFFLVLGCADPKYITESKDFGGAPAGKIDGVCSLSLSPSDLCLTWWWEGDKPKSGTNGLIYFKIYRLNLLDQSQVLVDLEKWELVLWMPDMGHGSVPVKITRLDQGTYQASPIHFIMPGEWEMRFVGTEGGKVVGETHVELTIF